MSTQTLSIVTVGHVDHGKSTVIGRLLADIKALPEGKLEQVKANCARSARPFEYAFLLDALKAEQAQGITIDAARCFFKTAQRHYLLIDAPGHVEFLKNMITGASRAEAALLVIDAEEGIQENSKRHGYIASMLGLRQIAVLVNKMDLVNYDQKVFANIEQQYREFLRQINVEPVCFIPVSGREGVNIAEHSAATPWYQGRSLVEQIDAFVTAEPPAAAPFRFPVQDVYKFTEQGDARRIVAGTVETGQIEVGTEVVFYPSAKKSRIASVEQFNVAPHQSAAAGEAVGFTLETQIYARSGELMTRADQAAPEVGRRFRVNLFWMGHAPMVPGKAYKLKLGATRSTVNLVKVLNVLDASELSSITNKNQVDRHDVAEVVLECPKPIAYDLVNQVERTGRLVIVDQCNIAGAGIVLESLGEDSSLLREHWLERERHWEKSAISAPERIASYHHRPKFIVFTGLAETGGELLARELARQLEKTLFGLNYKAYYLGMRNLNLGLDADLPAANVDKHEHIRHLGELARILTDAGQIFITAVPDLDEYDLQTLKLLNQPNELLLIQVGQAELPANLADLTLDGDRSDRETMTTLCQLLRERDIIVEYYI